ncbi:MAG: hypothetical protein ACFFD2_00030 [Promethearchaeota archaeon]
MTTYEIIDLILRIISTIGFFSLLVALYEIRKSNEQRFREVLTNYFQSMRETLRFRFEDKIYDNLYRTCLLILDQTIFSTLNRKNKINKNKITDELSRLSTVLYFEELDKVKNKLEEFKRDLFRKG